MKIYTKTGDKGETGLVDGSRVSKADKRIELLGTLDEVNAGIGLILTVLDENHTTRDLLIKTQSALFSCGSRIAEPQERSVLNIPLPDDTFIKVYEKSIDTLTKKMPPLKQFILPGGNELASRTHFVRSLVRRAERNLVEFIESGGIVEGEILRYLNRLSDWFFTLARYYNFEVGVKDITWRPGKFS